MSGVRVRGERRHTARWWRVLLALNFVACIVTIAIVSRIVNHARSQSQHADHALAIALNARLDAEAEIRTIVTHQCERLNVKQREDNRSQLADWRFDAVFIRLVRATPQPTAAGRQDVSEFLGPLIAAQNAKAWVPVVPNCATVGAKYRLPGAIAFSAALPAPADLPPGPPRRPHRQ